MSKVKEAIEAVRYLKAMQDGSRPPGSWLLPWLTKLECLLMDYCEACGVNEANPNAVCQECACILCDECINNDDTCFKCASIPRAGPDETRAEFFGGFGWVGRKRLAAAMADEAGLGISGKRVETERWRCPNHDCGCPPGLDAVPGLRGLVCILCGRSMVRVPSGDVRGQQKRR